MSKLFGGGKPKAPEPYKPSKQQIDAERKQLERQREQESEINEREAQRRKIMSGGRQSLLTGSALGVDDEMKDTLG